MRWVPPCRYRQSCVPGGIAGAATVRATCDQASPEMIAARAGRPRTPRPIFASEFAVNSRRTDDRTGFGSPQPSFFIPPYRRCPGRRHLGRSQRHPRRGRAAGWRRAIPCPRHWPAARLSTGFPRFSPPTALFSASSGKNCSRLTGRRQRWSATATPSAGRAGQRRHRRHRRPPGRVAEANPAFCTSSVFSGTISSASRPAIWWFPPNGRA